MDREILFRGKGNPEYNDGDWYYGYLLFDGKDYQIIEPKYGCFRRTVLKETIGEFTGMTDKNGTKIFEGDIVKTQSFYTRPYSTKRKEKQFLGIVEYHTATFRNLGSSINNQKYDASWRVNIVEDIGDYGYYNWTRFWNCEIVGNKFDNPELVPKE